jgi:hypothetical protein
MPHKNFKIIGAGKIIDISNTLFYLSQGSAERRFLAKKNNRER